VANFVSVLHLDTFALPGSIEKRMGLFKPTGVPGLRILRVRGVKTGTEEGPEEFVRYKPAAGWVELQNLRTEIERRAEALIPGGIILGEISLEMLDQGEFLHWTIETEPYFVRWSRAIVPLRTGPGVLFVCGTEVASPGIGWLTVVSPRLPHCAINMGDHSAIWLNVDFRRKDAPDV
jgi:hypothetical protein